MTGRPQRTRKKPKAFDDEDWDPAVDAATQEQEEEDNDDDLTDYDDDDDDDDEDDYEKRHEVVAEGNGVRERMGRGRRGNTDNVANSKRALDNLSLPFAPMFAARSKEQLVQWQKRFRLYVRTFKSAVRRLYRPKSRDARKPLRAPLPVYSLQHTDICGYIQQLAQMHASQMVAKDINERGAPEFIYDGTIEDVIAQQERLKGPIVLGSVEPSSDESASSTTSTTNATNVTDSTPTETSETERHNLIRLLQIERAEEALASARDAAERQRLVDTVRTSRVALARRGQFVPNLVTPREAQMDNLSEFDEAPFVPELSPSVADSIIRHPYLVFLTEALTLHIPSITGVSRRSRDLRGRAQLERESLVFSRVFDESISPTFYGGVMNDLRMVADELDRPENVEHRTVVWHELYKFLQQESTGYLKRHDCFVPIIDRWAKEPKLNLLSIELLFLAICQALFSHPEFVGEREDQTTNEHLRPSQDDDFDQSDISDAARIAKNLPSNSSASDVAAVALMSATGSVPKNLVRPKPIRPLDPVSVSSRLAVDLFRLNCVVSDRHVAFVLEELLLLRHWAHELDSLSEKHVNAIIHTCKLVPEFTMPKVSTLSEAIEYWSSCIEESRIHITVLFNALSFLKTHSELPLNFFFPNSTVPVFRASYQEPTVFGKMNYRPFHAPLPDLGLNVDLSALQHLIQQNTNVNGEEYREGPDGAMRPLKRAENAPKAPSRYDEDEMLGATEARTARRNPRKLKSAARRAAEAWAKREREEIEKARRRGKLLKDQEHRAKQLRMAGFSTDLAEKILGPAAAAAVGSSSKSSGAPGSSASSSTSTTTATPTTPKPKTKTRNGKTSIEPPTRPLVPSFGGRSVAVPGSLIGHLGTSHLHSAPGPSMLMPPPFSRNLSEHVASSGWALDDDDETESSSGEETDTDSDDDGTDSTRPLGRPPTKRTRF